MPDYSIPLSQDLIQMETRGSGAEKLSSFAGENIKPVPFKSGIEESAKAFKMADEEQQSKMNLEKNKDAANDKLIMDQYEKSSPDRSFLTPESIATAQKELKGKLSSSGWNDLEQLRLTRQAASLKTQKEFSEMNSAKLTEQIDKDEFSARYLNQPALDAYNNALLATGGKKIAGTNEIQGGDKTKAMQDYQATLQATNQMAAQLKNLDGTPMVPPEVLKARLTATPEKMEAMMAHGKFRTELAKAEQDKRKSTADIAKEEAQAEEAKAKAKYYEKGAAGGAGKGMKFASLTPAQQDALDQAMERGLLDPRKLNSRTAGMWADQYIKNPNLDMNKMSSDAAMMQNVQFENRALTLETLPEVMKNMVDAGKKVGFSDIRTVGKMQAFMKGETNDPDLASYMAQRNDALMTIASSMRGVGMSDMAHQAETEAANPTMSPKALDGWLQGQMKSLEPRLKRYQRFTRSNQEKPAEQTAGKAAPAWSSADEARLKELEAKHGAQ